MSLPAQIGDPPLLPHVAEWDEYHSLATLDEETLRQITRTHGVNFATALFFDRLRHDRAAFLDQIEAIDDTQDARFPGLTLLVIPGAFYREHRHTGADGEVIIEEARRRGCRAERLDLDSFAPLDENARRLCDWLDTHRQERIVLVSLCKGSADVKTALREQSLFGSVAGWVNLSGLLNGTELVNGLLRSRPRRTFSRLLCWWHRWSFEALREMRRGPGERLDEPCNIPEGMRVVHVVGFPLRRHLSDGWARKGHARLAEFGPNDGGGLLLADVLHWPGQILPLWGADHYLNRAVDIPALVVRLLKFLCG